MSIRFLRLGAATLLLCSASTAFAQQIKSPIRGLVSMGAYKFVSVGGDPDNTLAPLNAKPGIFGGLVIVATWSELQPTSKAPLADNNAIDQALALVRTYNSNNPQKPLAVKLRVWGGFEAPDWAKSIGGAPIDTTFNGKDRTVGRFWTVPYRKAWAQFQQQLADRYDSEPLIHEVSVTSCMSYTAEPFFLPVSDSDNVIGPLTTAGFAAIDYKRCLDHAVSDYAPWQTTRIEFPFNPLRTGPNQGNGDSSFTRKVMRNCRLAIGVQCVFDNHDLDANLDTSLLPVYKEMKVLGPEVEFQTFHETPDNFRGTIKLGVRYGASSIELWQDFGGFPLVPNHKLKLWASWLEQNTGAPNP